MMGHLSGMCEVLVLISGGGERGEGKAEGEGGRERETKMRGCIKHL